MYPHYISFADSHNYPHIKWTNCDSTSELSANLATQSQETKNPDELVEGLKNIPAETLPRVHSSCSFVISRISGILLYLLGCQGYVDGSEQVFVHFVENDDILIQRKWTEHSLEQLLSSWPLPSLKIFHDILKVPMGLPSGTSNGNA